MSSYRRNVMVGVTVLAGLIALGWMILKFGGEVAAPFAPRQFSVTFLADRADGVSEGSLISYHGVEAGRVVKTQLAEDSSSVIIDALINEKPALPGNLQGVIKQTSALGSGAAILLELTDHNPTGKLSVGQKLKAQFAGGLLPQEFSDLAVELKLAVRQFRDTNIVAHADEEVKRLGKLVESIQKYTDDPKIREDLTASIANFRSTTETANRVTANLEKFSGNLDKLSTESSETIAQAKTTIAKTQDQIDSIGKQMGDRLLQIAKLLDQFQDISTKVNNGSGSAGKLVNDPRLYESLVDTSKDLNATIKDLKRLVEQWEQEGVSLKLK